MRILLVTGSYPPGRCGVGDYSQQLATALAPVLVGVPGAGVAVLTTGTTDGAVDEAGVAVSRAMPDWRLRRIARLIRALRRIRPDIVHVQYPTQGYGSGKLIWFIPLLARCLGARVVQTWHEGFDHDLLKFLLLAIAPGRVVVVREAFLRQFGRAFGFVAGLRRLSYINGAATLPAADPSPAERAAIRARYGVGDRRLLMFFGFIYPAKQVEQLFAIADPDRDHILIVGDAGGQDDYLATITALTQGDCWSGRAQVIGFADRAEAAAIMATADALILPFRAGGGVWNTSILAGILQRVFVLTTATTAGGYDADTNVHYAAIDDLAGMKRALDTHAGTKRRVEGDDAFGWRSIAARHHALYASMRAGRGAKR